MYVRGLKDGQSLMQRATEGKTPVETERPAGAATKGAGDAAAMPIPEVGKARQAQEYI